MSKKTLSADKSLEFLGDPRFDGISSKMRRRGIQQGRIVDLDSREVMASSKPISTWIATRAPAMVAVVRTRTPPYSMGDLREHKKLELRKAA